MMYNMSMFEKKSFSILTSYDAKIFGIWRDILFSLHLEVLVFY